LTERKAIVNLAILALDGRLESSRDWVVAELRRRNPDTADAVEIAEFLVLLARTVKE
jgi:hypothetical protein